MAEAMNVRKYCPRFFKKMQTEITSDKYADWSLQLLREKLEALSKQIDKNRQMYTNG